MSGKATRSGQLAMGTAVGTFSWQNFSALSYVEFEIATISTSDRCLNAGRCRRFTIPPAPMIPIRNLRLPFRLIVCACRRIVDHSAALLFKSESIQPGGKVGAARFHPL